MAKHFKPWTLSRQAFLLLALAGIGFNACAQQPPPLVSFDQSQQNTVRGEISGVDFQRLPNGSGQLLLSIQGNIPSPQIVEAQGKLTLILDELSLAAEQLMSMDVTQFATPINGIETFQESNGSKIEITLQGSTGYNYRIEEQSLIINVFEQDEEVSASTVQNQYNGAPISLDFQDVPVRQVLQIVAQVNGFNLVTTDTVTGNVTISLTDVPWDQALDMILKIKGLDKRLEGNILLIAPAEELTARETQVLQSQQQVQALEALHTVSIPINYAKASAMADILNSSEGGILSQRGTATVDERTNTLLVRDTLPSIDQARDMIEVLDIPVKQVLIESRMVTVLDNIGEQLGVRWGFSDLQDDIGVSGTLDGADSIAAGIVPSIDNRMNVNLPIANAAGSIGFQMASLVDGTILDLELSALESENKGEIIASPRITVANQQEAYIEQGTEIPYVQATSSGATSVEFKKAVLSLKVTPHITPDNRIILDLVVTQDTRGETVSTSTGDAVAIDTQEIKTQVLVENGETIVLGGIFQQTSTDSATKVPLFGDLPVVGGLFRNTSELQQKRELLIFVTPKIITDIRE